MKINTIKIKDLKAWDGELIKRARALLAGRRVQIKGAMQRRLGGSFIGGLFDRPI